MPISTRLATLALAGALCLGPQAWADDVGGAAVVVSTTDCGDSVTAEILGVLLGAGNIGQAQYEALCAKARGEAAPARAAAPAEAPSDAPTWDLYFSGTVYERVFFKVQYEFAQSDDDDNPDFKDVYMGLKNLGPVGSVRVGHFKEPFTLEEWTSSKYITFLERGLNAAFFPGRNMGVMPEGNAFDKNLMWQAAAFQDVNDQGFAFDEWGDGQYDLSARVVGTPVYQEEGSKVLHLGFDYIHRFRDESVR